MTISVVINARNEERTIGRAIRSCVWADEILVADMRSEDRTAAIASTLGAKVIQVPVYEWVEPARAIALERASGEWLLVVDADEMVPRTLADQLRSVASRRDVDVVMISHRNYLMGARLESSGWELKADRHPRFFRKGFVTFSSDIHALAVQPNARILQLPATEALSFVHFNYRGFDQFIEKLNRYTKAEALSRPHALLQTSRWRLMARLMRRFVGRYIKHHGFREDYRGLSLALLMCAYEVAAWAKAHQYAEVGDEASVDALYDGVASEVLQEYEG